MKKFIGQERMEVMINECSHGAHSIGRYYFVLLIELISEVKALNPAHTTNFHLFTRPLEQDIAVPSSTVFFV